MIYHPFESLAFVTINSRFLKTQVLFKIVQLFSRFMSFCCPQPDFTNGGHIE